MSTSGLDKDTPVLLGRISAVVSGELKSGYAPIHALMSTSCVYGKSDVYDRPYSIIQLKLTHNQDGVTVSIWDLRNAEEFIERKDPFSDGSMVNRDRQVIGYAREIGSAPHRMTVA